jgi:hypothetical protein
MADKPTPALADIVGKTFRPKSGAGPCYKVTAVLEKSMRHKQRDALMAVRVGADSYFEPLASDFLAEFTEAAET